MIQIKLINDRDVNIIMIIIISVRKWIKCGTVKQIYMQKY